MTEDTTPRRTGPDDAAAERTMLEAVREAMGLMETAESWPRLRDALEAVGLTRRLGATGMQRLAEVWRQRTVGALDDAALSAEVRFWADGGDLPQHPDGFRAPVPADLAAEAGRRGWFVRALDSGGWLVNPPDGHPLMLPARR
ncbi:hypothetical protein [Roseospira goensis]|uniref:Uncharacterized protein n=1 Tax=Roseospira goensis TaxID=391922 RepID=A0A7W6WKU7_9PROT|nr:hypothetical protein [Roseospira goensis]MBB4286033.1 hypothetical protein [Roseospira goensis]